MIKVIRRLDKVNGIEALNWLRGLGGLGSLAALLTSTKEESRNHQIVLSAHLHPIQPQHVYQLLRHGVNDVIIEEIQLQCALARLVGNDMTVLVAMLS